MSATRQITGLAALAMHAFVGFEFLFMIMPFVALAYYPAYGGMLSALADSQWTAGLTVFFLPHFSSTNDALMDSLAAYGRWTALAGIVLFLASAGPLYFSKLFLRKEGNLGSLCLGAPSPISCLHRNWRRIAVGLAALHRALRACNDGVRLYCPCAI